MQETLRRVGDAILSVSQNTFHYHAFKKPDQFFVWAESGESSAFYADNGKEGQTIEGTIDYFTRTEYDPAVDRLQEVLRSAKIGFSLKSVQYEDETKYIHFEWEFEVECNG